MAERLPQLNISPGAIRRQLPPPDGTRAASVQSREASSVSPLRDFSPLPSSAPSNGSADGLHVTLSLELVELKDTAESVEELLKNQLVILSGGRDKEGQSILTVPSKPKDFHYSKGDLLRVIQYLTSLPRDEIRECGYSLIIDGRSATWSTIKNLLHMFQECLPGQIHVAYVLSPSHFLEKKRASMRMSKEKDRLEFTTTVVPHVDKLNLHLDMNQVTTDLGGLLPYNHREWMKMRMDVEHFIASYNALLQRFAVFERELCLDVLAEDSEVAEKMLSQHASLLQEIRGAPKNVQKEGTDILVVIEQNQDNFGQSSMTPEKINTMAVVRNLLERVNKRAQMLEDLWRSRKHNLDQTLQLRVFENAIGKINGWLKSKSPEILGGKQEIGDSVEGSEELLRAFHRTEAKSRGVQDNMTKLRMMADRMCGANHFASEDLNHHIAKLNSRWARHNELMGLRKRILENAITFHKQQNKFVEVCDELSRQLQSPLPKVSGPEDVVQLLSQLKELQSSAGQAMAEVKTTAQSLGTLMQRAVSTTQGSQLAQDYRRGLYEMETVQTGLKENLTTVGHLVEARRTALGQCRQVFKCEQDVVKVIAWLQHLANQMMSTQGDLGESQEAVQYLQSDHQKFAETAKKTFLGGQDLLNTALKNREQYSLDLFPNRELGQGLSTKWDSIDSAIKERERRLDMADSFHRTTEGVFQELEGLSHPTSNVPETRVGVERAVEELGHHGNELRKRTQDAVALGESLLLTMAQPLFNGQTVNETNQQASLCAELIRSRIDHLKSVSLDFHQLLQLRRKCLKDAVLLRSVEEEVSVIRVWCKGEGLLQVGVVLKKGMTLSELKKLEQEHTNTTENKWMVIERLKNAADSVSESNHFGPQIVAMATELLAVWSEYLSESSTLSGVCRTYVTFWDSSKQLDELTTQFSTQSSEADLCWEDATSERLKELQRAKEELSERAQQVMAEGFQVVEKLGKVPNYSALVQDVERQTLEVKRRMEQIHAYWLKVESMMSNTLQLSKYKEEACALLIEMNEMVGELGRIDFGSTCDEFEVKEQAFGAVADQCSVYLHRCDELKSLIQRLVLLGVAGDSEGACEKIVVEMGSLRSVLQTTLDSVKRGFEGADDITRKCAKVCQKIAVLDQLSPTISKADYIKELASGQEDVVAAHHNWLELVKSFAIGDKLSGEVEEACQLASEVIGEYHQQVEEMRKVRQVEQEADKHIEWLDSRVRQFLIANAEIGENGEFARELKTKLTNFLDSVQPSLNGIVHLLSLCQSLADSGSTMVGLIHPHQSRLKECREMCEKPLRERLDICTAFVDFEDVAEQELKYIKQVEGYCEEIPVVMDDPQRGGDILQSGATAVDEMTALIAVLEKKVSTFAQLAFSDVSVEMAPPLHVDGALSRLTQELSMLRNKVGSVIQRWKQGEAELQCLMEYNEFWSNHKEITSWLQLQGLPYLSTGVGSRLSEAEELVLEQKEFQSKVKKIEREVEAVVALGNSATARNPVPEVGVATSDLISYFTWFKQLVELRGRTLARAVAFFKEVKKISRSLATLTADSKGTDREKLAREIGRIRTMAEDIATKAAQLQTEGSPIVGESLLHVVDSLEDQLTGDEVHGILSPELPQSDTPQHTLSPQDKPSLPKRRDSKRRYQKYSASARRSSPTSQDGVEDVDMGKKAQLRSVAMVTKELCESEEEYVYCLSLLVEHYLTELSTSPHRPDFIVERKAEVFGNADEVYAFHKKLLNQLREAKGTEQICRCFLQLELDFRVYIKYLKTVSSGWKTLTLFGGSFFDDVKRSKRLGYPMIECYNRTFQRLEQYCRIFKELLVATQKEDLHSVRAVQQAVAMVTKTHKFCTNLVAFGSLRGSPTPLPEEGLLLVDDFIILTIKNKKKHPQQLLTVFLHEDCLVLAKAELKDPIHPPIYHFQGQLLCSELMLTETYKAKDSKLKFAISSGPISTAETVHILHPAFKEGAEELKDTWTRTINDLLMRQLETLKALKGHHMHENLPPPIVHHVDINKKEKRSFKEARESKRVSKLPDDKRASEHVTIEKIAPTDIKSSVQTSAMSDIYMVYKNYQPNTKDELALSVGQLVEVLDQSGKEWLVCTIGNDTEPMEVFVPAKALRMHQTDESGRPLSIVSQYSYVSQVSPDRSSIYSQGPPPELPPDTLSQGSGSRPTSMVAMETASSHPTSVAEDLTHPVSLPPHSGDISAPLHQPSIVAEDITWYCVKEYFDNEAGFGLQVGEAVEVLDTSGPQWYVCTIEDPREGFVPPHVLSQVPSAQLLGNQPSVVEDKTPTESQPPLGGQVSVVEAQTPTPQQEEAGLAATLTHDLQETVIAALMDKQQQESASTPTDLVKTPTDPAKTPTDLAGSPTEPAVTPTDPTRTATDLDQSPAESAKTPTDLAGIPTEPAMTQTEPPVTSTEPAKTPTEPSQTPIVQVSLAADDSPPSDRAPPPVGEPFLSELKAQLERNSSGTPPSVTVVIPPPILPPGTQGSLESQKSGALYTALAGFEGSTEENTASLHEGQLVRVVDQSQVEWWLVIPLAHTGEEEAKEGWVPANFLQALDDPPPSDHGSSVGTPATGGDQTPVDIGDQTPGLLITSDPFDAVSTDVQQPMASQPEVVEVKPRLYTSIAHVMARHPNELSLQLAEIVEVVDDNRKDWWLVRTMPTASVPFSEGWVPTAALIPFMQEEAEPPKEDEVSVMGPGTHVVLADFVAFEHGQLNVEENQVVKVIDDSRDDWTLVLAENGEGWVPREYLQAQDGSEATDGADVSSAGSADVSSNGSADMDVEEAVEVETLSPVQDLLEFTVSELVKSEKEYVARLNYAMLHYLPVIFESMAPRALRAQKETLLGNLEEIWQFHSKHFLPALVNAGNDLNKIGQAFLDHRDSFEHYITFCGNKTRSEAVYSEFRPHMMEAMHALGQRLELSSYLILPIQRLTKCGLLLADILKYVNRLGHKSLPLEMAAMMLQDASTRSNNSIHYFELEGLAKKDLPLSDLDFQDLFWVKCDGVWKERRVFLFKTAIVLTKPLLHEGMGQSLVIQKVVDLPCVSMADDDLEEALSSLVFYDLKAGSKIILQAPNAEIKSTWAKKINDLINNCKHVSKTALTRTMSDSLAVSFKRGTSFNLRRSWLSRTRSEKRRRLTDGGSPLVVKKKASGPPTVGSHLLVLECIVVEDADDVTLEAGDTVKLLRIVSPDKYLVQTVGNNNSATMEGIVSAEFVRAIGEESKLEVAPEIQLFPGSTVVHLGKSAILSCCFAAYPAPSVVWMKDSQVIHPTQKVKVHTSPTSSVLELLGVEFSDKGEYTCVVTNSGGSTEASGYLLVQGPPGAPGQPNAVKVTSTTAKLKWTSPIFDGGDDVIYQVEQQHLGSQAWQPVVQLSKPAFLVRDLEPATVYAFRVIAFHTHGYSPPSQVSEPVKTKPLAKSAAARNDHAISPDFLSSPSPSTPPCEPQSYLPCFIRTSPVSDSYSILNHVLGVGQFSVVRQAFNRQTNQVCAAKEVGNKLLGCSEAKILHQLDHPHIVKLFGTYELMENVTLMIELVSEGELLEYIVSKDNLTEAVCVRYLTQLLHALDYLSQKNLVHLDIKPENLLLSRSQSDSLTLKLIDFGSAHEASLPEAPREFISPEFLPPEVLGRESPCSCSVSDMWSVGVVTYVMLSGISPFFASTPESTVSRIIDARYSFSNDAFAQVSEDAKSFIASLLQLSPRHRLTASKALQHIWITTLGTSNEGWPMAKLDTTLLRRFLSRRKWLCKAVAVGVSLEEESGDSSPSIVALRNERCESPLLWDGPHDVTAASGSRVTLRCRFSGIPNPSVYWYHEGTEVTSGDTVSLSAKEGVASLHILGLEPGMAGEYTCTAVNSVGTASTQAIITAQDVPGSPAEIKVVPLSPMSALLSWIPPKSHGNSDLQHYVVEQSPARKECWTEFTRSASTTALVVDNLSFDETYNFRVSAVNRVGQGPFSKPITLERSHI